MIRSCTCEVACNGHYNAATYEIAEYLNVPIKEAEQIQNMIDIYFNLDWSEADYFESRMTFIAAYEFFQKYKDQL